MRERIIKISKKWKGLWQDSENAGSSVARGGVIVFFSRISMKAIYFIRTIILARLLFPHDFGLFGLASVSLALFDTFFQSGFNSALIHEKGDSRKYLDVAWTIGVVRNAFLATLFFFAAPFVGVFFHNAEVVPLIKVLALSMFVIGFENIGIVLFQKELRFNKSFFYNITIIVCEVVGALIAAFFLRNAWALVVGALVNRVSAVILSYLMSSYRPRFSFDFRSAQYLFRYGKWMWLLSVIGYFVSQGDNLTIGKMFSTTDLGYYQLAFGLALLPSIEISRSLGGVLFPTFSKIREDKEVLRRSFIRSARFILSLTIPASVGLILLSREIVLFVYGERWLPMIPILSVLAIYGFIKSFEYIVTPLLMGVGKPRISGIGASLQLFVMAVAIIPLALSLGLVGVAWAVFLGGLASQTFLLFAVRKEITLGLRGIGEVVGLPLFASLIMGLVLLFLQYFLPVKHAWQLFLFVFGGALIYFIALLGADRFSGKKMYNSLLWIKQNL